MIEPKEVSPAVVGTKLKLEFTDRSGAKYSVNIQDPSRENLGKLLDFVSTLSSATNPQLPNEQIDTNFARVYGLIQNKFRFSSFTSNDVFEAYEEEFGLPTSLSTISTYLARLGHRHLLTRSRSGLGWTYRIAKHDEEIRLPLTQLQSETPIINP